MNLKIISLIAFGITLIGLFFLADKGYILSKNPITITIQVLSFGLMLWARFVFGFRSFHATVNSTEGKLVTNGPYKCWRHPIYAAVIYFFLSCLIAYPNTEAIIAVTAIVIGTYTRMVLEEKLLIKTYPEYVLYKKQAKRLVPFLF